MLLSVSQDREVQFNEPRERNCAIADCPLMLKREFDCPHFAFGEIFKNG